MKKIITIFLCCQVWSFLSGQQVVPTAQRAVVELQTNQLNQIELKIEDGSVLYRIAAMLEVPVDNAEPFLAVSLVWDALDWDTGNQFTALFYDEDEKSEVVRVQKDEHADPPKGKHISQLMFAEKNTRKVRLHYTGKAKIENIKVHFFSPCKSAGTLEEQPEGMDSRSACSCSQPPFVKRSDWCPNNNCPPNPSPSFTNVTHLIVHHSAGSNFSNDWAAVVRAIWDFHVNTNGWSDIGYNWLIDPDGVLYEGRGDNIFPAHFCQRNSGTMGVCLLGNFTNVAPAQNAINKLRELLSWKACDKDIDPLGSSFHNSSGLYLKNISGHRDGCATACPGNSFYPLLPSVRSGVKGHIENVCQNITATGETEKERGIRIFPNPTSGELFIEMGKELRQGEVEVIVYDVLGKLVILLRSSDFDAAQNAMKFDTGGLAPGIYWLAIKKSTGDEVFRIAKY